MMEIDARHGAPEGVHILNLSREELIQQTLIPPSAAIHTLLMLHSRAAVLSSASPSSVRGSKAAMREETSPGKHLNKTISLSHKVKKSGKPQVTVIVESYKSLIACNGNFEQYYSNSKKGHWSTKQHRSKSRRPESLPSANGDMKKDLIEESIKRREHWKRDAEQDLIGLGGQFVVEGRTK